jgi:hypothetical protein
MEKFNLYVWTGYLPVILAIIILILCIEPTINFFYSYNSITQETKVKQQLSKDFKTNLSSWLNDEVYIVQTIFTKKSSYSHGFFYRMWNNYLPFIDRLQWFIIINIIMLPIDIVLITGYYVMSKITPRDLIRGSLGRYMSNEPKTD